MWGDIANQAGQGASAALTGLSTEHLFALAAALGWASGLRLYAVVFLTGLAGALGWVPLPAGLRVLQQPLVLGLAGVLLVLEFIADKIPALDSLWDAVHSVVRIPAAAALAAAVFGADQGTWAVLAGLLGGTLALGSQVAKSTTRAAINTSPEPFSNVAASLLGDAAVPTVLWLAWAHPAVAVGVLALATVLGLVLTVLLMKFLRGLLRGLRGRFGAAPV